MKKLFYMFLIVAFTSIVTTSCTEEEVQPATGQTNGGGASTDGKN